uniref:21kDa protein n=1 Tax=Grapevine Kizil Sapak virus TaxID=2650001 RepID=A0A6J4CUP2_9VIRU|nr:21kDa protein [Grapevine Kizil Sapak virus]
MTQGLYLQLYSLINKGFSLPGLYASIYKIFQFPSWASKFVPFTKIKERRTVSDGSIPRYRKAGYATLSEATSAFAEIHGSGHFVCWDWSPGFKQGLSEDWPNIRGVCGVTRASFREPCIKIWAADLNTLKTILTHEVQQSATRDVEVLRSVDGSLKEFEDEVGQGSSGNTLQIPASSFSRDNNEAIWLASVER